MLGPGGRHEVIRLGASSAEAPNQIMAGRPYVSASTGRLGGYRQTSTTTPLIQTARTSEDTPSVSSSSTESEPLPENLAKLAGTKTAEVKKRLREAFLEEKYAAYKLEKCRHNKIMNDLKKEEASKEDGMENSKGKGEEKKPVAQEKIEEKTCISSAPEAKAASSAPAPEKKEDEKEDSPPLEEKNPPPTPPKNDARVYYNSKLEEVRGQLRLKLAVSSSSPMENHNHALSPLYSRYDGKSFSFKTPKDIHIEDEKVRKRAEKYRKQMEKEKKQCEKERRQAEKQKYFAEMERILKQK